MIVLDHCLILYQTKIHLTDELPCGHEATMADERHSSSGASERSGQYSYPSDLARFVHDQWKSTNDAAAPADQRPQLETLEVFFSACYHASLAREEERPVTFRAILASPSLFEQGQRPPDGLQLLDFSKAFRFSPEELRRLSVAADPERTLVGVQSVGTAGADLEIWGVINSGSRWLRDVKGG